MMMKRRIIKFFKENANADALALKETFDENLLLMEQLTERILAWQDTFGKYAV